MDETPRSVSDDSARTREIREEIEHTREDMSETIDAIQEKLRPKNIVADAKQRVKRAAAERLNDMAQSAGDTATKVMSQTSETAGGLYQAARRNPLPAAILGVGAAWFLMNRMSSSRRPSQDWRRQPDDWNTYDEDYGTAGYDNGRSGIVGRIMDNPGPALLTGVGLAWFALSGDRDTSSSRFGYASSTLSSAKEAVSDTMGRVADRASETAGRVAERASDTVGRAAERAQEYAGQAGATLRQTRRRAQNQLERMVETNPLLVSAGALLIGAAIGLSIPETEAENEWMGEARDAVLEGAQQAAQTAATTVQQAAGDVAAEAVGRIIGTASPAGATQPAGETQTAKTQTPKPQTKTSVAG